MQRPPDSFFDFADFVPSLQEAFASCRPDSKRIILVSIPIKDPHQHPTLVPAITDRRLLALSDGRHDWFWEVESLRSLFRGNRQPPILGDYPEAYNDSFILLDLHALEVSEFLGDRTDAEMREVYSLLRRRPDSKSIGFLHDYMWQAAAWILGTRPLSQAEFEAILARLERSCRTFEMGPASRNYLATLHRTLGRASSDYG